jgi:cytochrome c2
MGDRPILYMRVKKARAVKIRGAQMNSVSSRKASSSKGLSLDFSFSGAGAAAGAAGAVWTFLLRSSSAWASAPVECAEATAAMLMSGWQNGRCRETVRRRDVALEGCRRSAIYYG